MGVIRFIGNVLWFIGGGLISFFTWLILGLGLCVTLIGIPFGLQCFKVATLVLAPFGKEVVYGGKTGSFLMNILWLPLGLVLCLEQVALGLIYCITIIGIPAGLQAFKMAKIALMPFGTEIRKKSEIKKAAEAEKKQAEEQSNASTEQPAQAQPNVSAEQVQEAQVVAGTGQPGAGQAQPVQPQNVATHQGTTTTQSAAVAPAPAVSVPINPAEPATSPAPTPAGVASNVTPDGGVVNPAPVPVGEASDPAPAPTEPATDVKEPEKKSNQNRIIMVVVVTAVVLTVLGVAGFIVISMLYGGVRKVELPGYERPVQPVQESVETNRTPASIAEEIALICADDYGGEWTMLGVSYIDDLYAVDNYYCSISIEPTNGFVVHIADTDYRTIIMNEERLRGEDVDSEPFVVTGLANYIYEWYHSGALLDAGTVTYDQIMRDNIIIEVDADDYDEGMDLLDELSRMLSRMI